MKRDPYKHQEKYLLWKERIDEVGYIEGISKKNSEIILKYIFDMELGMNVSRKSAKGSRSYLRLNNLKQRMIFISKRLEAYYDLSCLTDLTEHQIIAFFSKMRSGEIKRVDGGEYKSVVDFVKIFKAFWHWHMKVNKKEGIEIADITEDLDCSKNKPRWVYLDEQQVRHLCENAKYNYKVLIMFLFDSGIRSPTELVNIKVSDFLKDYRELNIRDEVSKTFGRRIKMMMCSGLIKEYVQAKNLSSEDYIFDITPCVVNRYLKRLSKKLFGEENSLAGQKYSDLTMYDFRHISCCYWLPRYKSESALKFRFGWKKSDKIHYYSEMLGMKDTISEDDMLIDVTKTELEQRVTKAENEKEVLNERLQVLEKQMSEILVLVKRGELAIPLMNSRN